MNYNIMERTACGIPGLASIVNNFCAAVRVCVRASENRLTRRIKIFWSRGRTENYKNNLTRSRKPARASEIAEIILLLFFSFSFALGECWPCIGQHWCEKLKRKENYKKKVY